MSKDGQMVWRNHQNFTSLQGTLYLCSTPNGEDEDLLLFVVHRAHQIATRMDAIRMQDTKAMTLPFPCYKNVFGGQDWSTK